MTELMQAWQALIEAAQVVAIAIALAIPAAMMFYIAATRRG